MVTLFLRIFVPFEECIQVWCQSLFIDIINKSIRLWIALLQLHAPFDDVKKYLSRNHILKKYGIDASKLSKLF